jgi:signal transduction histidine kinase/phage shock protein PspC (stress-responsive transcriptional regulator)
LVRAVGGRGIGGVARGVGAHLGLKVTLVRWAFAIGSLAVGAGALLYVFLWMTVPPQTSPDGQPLPVVSRLRWTRLTSAVVAGALCLLAAALLLAQWSGADVRWEWWLPAGALIGGVALVWSQLQSRGSPRNLPADAVPPATGRSATWASRLAGYGYRAGSEGWEPLALVRLAGGLGLVIAGVVLLVWRNQPAGSLGYAILAGLAVLAGVATVLAPWWLGLLRELGDERAARAREAERADIAAHLHDSVLQTLAVMRARAEDPDTVRRLARAQERELRSWLYEKHVPASDSVAAGLKELVAEVEDASGLDIGTVIVGDAEPWPASEALLRAVREALANATRHGAPPVDVYLEVSERGVEAYVRDRGPGFDLAKVSPDRLGVRESIIGRIQRVGGTAEVIRPRAGGTEVRLSVPSGAGRNGQRGGWDDSGAAGDAASSA